MREKTHSVRITDSAYRMLRLLAAQTNDTMQNAVSNAIKAASHAEVKRSKDLIEGKDDTRA